MKKNEIVEIVSELLQIEDIDEIYSTKDLREIGMDSILFIQLVIEIENKLNIELDDEDLLIDNFLTIDSIMNMVDKYEH